MINRLLLILSILTITTPAYADYLGCYEPNATVSGATLDIDTATQPTSPGAKVYDPDDTTTPTATPTLSAVDATGAIGQFRLADFSVGASPVYGTWTIRYYATMSDSVIHHATDTFDVRATCPLKPATSGRTLVVDASGLADANAVKLGPTGAGTAQTARDIGASVLLSSGTGTGQISLSSGAVLLQPTQTGVTIPTVTTVTNAPTNGDFTSTMKTSLNSSTPASVGTVTGNVNGNVTGSVTVGGFALATPGQPYCDITASTSGTSFTIGACFDAQGNSITIAANKFVGSKLEAYTNGGTTCNVNGQSGLVIAMSAGGVVTIQNVTPPNQAFTAAPNTTNCGVIIK